MKKPMYMHPIRPRYEPWSKKKHTELSAILVLPRKRVGILGPGRSGGSESVRICLGKSG
jgi:hypothetical protein